MASSDESSDPVGATFAIGTPAIVGQWFAASPPDSASSAPRSGASASASAAAPGVGALAGGGGGHVYRGGCRPTPRRFGRDRPRRTARAAGGRSRHLVDRRPRRRIDGSARSPDRVRAATPRGAGRRGARWGRVPARKAARRRPVAGGGGPRSPDPRRPDRPPPVRARRSCREARSVDRVAGRLRGRGCPGSMRGWRRRRDGPRAPR